LGNHNLSGAVIAQEALNSLLDIALPDWKNSSEVKNLLGKKVINDDFTFLFSEFFSLNIGFLVRASKLLHLDSGDMSHRGDYIISLSQLVKWLGKIAKNTGIEILTGFSAQDIIWDEKNNVCSGVKLKDQGLDKKGNKQPNFQEGEIINADFVVLSEGSDGFITGKFLNKANLQRTQPQLYSIGIKEIIEVSSHQYNKFTESRVVHSLGYPIWNPLSTLGMFGGGILYPNGNNQISAGMIVGLDWKYYDFNPQEALLDFKKHKFINQFISGGKIIESGAKMISEGGYYAIPRNIETGAIGKSNCIIIGESAGFVNMLKIKGLHLAINSGIIAASAIENCLNNKINTAIEYTKLIDNSTVGKEMFKSRNFRQTLAGFGITLGLPLSVFSRILPRMKVEDDFKAMKHVNCNIGNNTFDKAAFTATASVKHREDEPGHLIISDNEICKKCKTTFNCPCVIFCPAGVYEIIDSELKPVNPSNCLHCKTCQRKCPFNNVKWTVPEASGGPQYDKM